MGRPKKSNEEKIKNISDKMSEWRNESINLRRILDGPVKVLMTYCESLNTSPDEIREKRERIKNKIGQYQCRLEKLKEEENKTNEY